VRVDAERIELHLVRWSFAVTRVRPHRVVADPARAARNGLERARVRAPANKRAKVASVSGPTATASFLMRI